MLYGCVYFFTVSSTDEFVITLACHVSHCSYCHFCIHHFFNSMQLRMWLLIVGYFLCFGTIVVKMWRVFYIFHNPSVKRKKSRVSYDSGTRFLTISFVSAYIV